MSADNPGEAEAEAVRNRAELQLAPLAETELDEHAAIFDQVRRDLTAALHGLTEEAR